MAWSDTDVEECKAKLEELQVLEQTQNDRMNKIRNVSRGLDRICSDNAMDIDTSEITDERKTELKTTLITEADKLLN